MNIEYLSTNAECLRKLNSDENYFSSTMWEISKQAHKQQLCPFLLNNLLMCLITKHMHTRFRYFRPYVKKIEKYVLTPAVRYISQKLGSEKALILTSNYIPHKNTAENKNHFCIYSRFNFQHDRGEHIEIVLERDFCYSYIKNLTAFE